MRTAEELTDGLIYGGPRRKKEVTYKLEAWRREILAEAAERAFDVAFPVTGATIARSISRAVMREEAEG